MEDPAATAPARTVAGPSVHRQSELRFLVGKVARHVRWAREDGLARLVEEDELDPVDRVRQRWVKAAWRRRHGVPAGSARCVLLVGLQRSGTNMVARGLDRAPEFEVRNENDRAAFRRYRLRPEQEVSALLRRSRHEVVLLKPLCDSHRTVELLHAFSAFVPKAVWSYRDVDGRARSAVRKFGDDDRLALTALARGDGADLWQGGGWTPGVLEAVRSAGPEGLTPHEASALFWWVRNTVFFEQGLHERDDVALVSYDGFVEDPAGQMHALADFLSVRDRPELVSHVDARAAGASGPLPLRADVRRLCDDLRTRLDAVALRPARRSAS